MECVCVFPQPCPILIFSRRSFLPTLSDLQLTPDPLETNPHLSRPLSLSLSLCSIYAKQSAPKQDVFDLTSLLNRVGLCHFQAIRIELYVTSPPLMVSNAYSVSHSPSPSIKPCHQRSKGQLSKRTRLWEARESHHINLSLTSLQFARTFKHHVIGTRSLM